MPTDAASVASKAAAPSLGERRAAKGAPRAAQGAYDLPAGVRYAYGTAGFRMHAALMAPVAYRMGAFAALLSVRHGGRAIGVILTASHNAVGDNGIKLVAPHGEMIGEAWEAASEALANCPQDRLAALYAQMAGAEEAGQEEEDAATHRPPVVVIGRDTRPSGRPLYEAVAQGIALVRPDALVLDGGVATTPELHTAVARLNACPALQRAFDAARMESLYLDELCSAFREAISGRPLQRPKRLVIDAANGVGAPKLAALAAPLARLNLHLAIVNDGSVGVLNEQCGADYVKSNVCLPRLAAPPSLQEDGARSASLETHQASLIETHHASLDGDADRLVYYQQPLEASANEPSSAFALLDGDRISALAVCTLRRLLGAAAIATGPEALSLGAVHTAYSNGGLTAFCAALGVPTVCTSTGVKHLHAAASKTFDIGIYFEANGHGTILYSQRAASVLGSIIGGTSTLQRDEAGLAAARSLLAIGRLANQLVGDGLADMLLVEAMLALNGDMSIAAWLGLYDDLPSFQCKVAVPDLTAIRTTDAERRLEHPAALQRTIDGLIARAPKGSRAFIRPSGTESVVRIFAEVAAPSDGSRSGSPTAAKDLARAIEAAIVAFFSS